MDAATVSAPVPEKRQKLPKKGEAVSVRWRLAVASRVLAALLGGYLLAALSSVCLGQLLVMAFNASRAEATVLSMTLSFLVYLPAVLWCFACRSALRAWLGLLVPCAILGAVYGCIRWLS
jgi:hypothetical protein